MLQHQIQHLDMYIILSLFCVLFCACIPSESTKKCVFFQMHTGPRDMLLSWPRGKVQMTIISCNLVQTMSKEEGQLAPVLGLVGPHQPLPHQGEIYGPLSCRNIPTNQHVLSYKPYFVPANQHANLFNQSACFLINRTLFQPINTQTYSTNQHAFL